MMRICLLVRGGASSSSSSSSSSAAAAASLLRLRPASWLVNGSDASGSQHDHRPQMASSATPLFTRGIRMRAGASRLRRDATDRTKEAEAAKNTAMNINLTSVVAPVLFRIHPDRMQMHAPTNALANEEAMKQLNQFLELAACAWQNDGQKTRQLLSLTLKQQQQQQEQPQHQPPPRVRGVLIPTELRFPLEFFLPFHHESVDNASAKAKPQHQHQQQHQEAAKLQFRKVHYIIRVPNSIVRTTLADNSAGSDSDLSIMQLIWRQQTKVILRELYILCGIPLNDKSVATTWLTSADEDEQSESFRRLHNAQRVEKHNRAARQSMIRFEKNFNNMLSREKHIVHRLTTGIEEGDMNQHRVLVSLLKERVFVQGFGSTQNTAQVFNWFASLLLANFLPLKLHALVWNRMVLLLVPQPTIRESVLRRATSTSRLKHAQTQAALSRWKVFENPDDNFGLVIQIQVPPLHELSAEDKPMVQQLNTLQDELVGFLRQRLTRLETRMVLKRR